MLDLIVFFFASSMGCAALVLEMLQLVKRKENAFVVKNVRNSEKK